MVILFVWKKKKAASLFTLGTIFIYGFPPGASGRYSCVVVAVIYSNIKYAVKLHFNLLNPTGYVMHQQFNIQQLYVLPTLYLCFVFI